MKKVTLHFQDLRDLRRFMNIVESDYIEMIAQELTLTCNCEDTEIELAQKAFNATIIKIDADHS
jgi:hypothetical protein